MSNPQIFQVKSLKCEKVVVFTDRAEVKRFLKVKLNQGENELIITNLSNLIDQDSIRVEGRGAATVLDVICQSKRVQVDEVDLPDKIKKLQLEINEYEDKQKILAAKNERLEKQRNILNEYANSLSKQVSNCEESKHVNNFLNFLETYEKRVEQADVEKLELNAQISQNDEQLNIAKQNLNKMNSSNSSNIIEVTILVEAKAPDTEIDLFISYVINNASWTPKYDIRVYSDNKTMIINYYGIISQSTGEDWNDTQVSLSTAVPSIGGNVPDLYTLNVRIKPKYSPNQNRILNQAMLFSASRGQERFRSLSTTVQQNKPLETQSMNVKEGLIASTFDIPRQTTIPSDNTTHKVSIGIINLNPEFEYETVPRKSQHAFLKAKVKNTSIYAILAGPANVFLDNNFVAKTQLKSYSPQEEFTCSLGVDPSIRIDYKPLRKYQEESGILSKTKIIKYEKNIEIKNTTKNTIKLLLSEQLPLSNDDKIQVKLIEPVLKNNQIVMLNKLNNLQFDLILSAGKQEDVIIKYSIEHPSTEDIEFN